MNLPLIKLKFLFVLITAIIFSYCSNKIIDDSVEILSPDKRIRTTVTTKGGENNSALMYDISFNDNPVLSDSKLGIELKDSGIISDDLTIVGMDRRSVDEFYAIPFGKSIKINDKYNEAVISLEDSEKRRIDLIFRAYNDGIAFRYHFPEQEHLRNIEITSELSHFHFPGNHQYWGMHLEGYTTSYENSYTIADIENITPDSLTAVPLLIKVQDDVWLGITEANLTDYAGMYLKGSPDEKRTLVSSLSPLPDSSGICVKSVTPKSTPWRVFMTADNPGRLVESNIILNLNDPPAFDTSWIKPGKCAWDWWCCQKVTGEDFKGAMDNRTMKHFIDFAGEMGLEYMLVDAGWYSRKWTDSDITKSIPEIDIPYLVKYANARGVDILIWLHWTFVEKQMEEAFLLYEKWGVKGVKIDFMNRDDQEMVNFYHRVLKKAADHKLTVDFHGAYKPTGIRRTYPNLLTREGVMGMEYLKVSDRVNPEYNCIIPFTRMLAGPMDYTPGGFTNVTLSQFKPNEGGWSSRIPPMTPTTRCHQLALFVILESPLQMLCDYPGNYRNNTGTDFLKHVPAVWDKTQVLHAKVGDYISIARKKEDEWYLGSITDLAPRELSANLNFLGSGDYVAEIYADGPDADVNAKSISASRMLVTKDNTIKIKMGPGGGHAVRFYPAPAGVQLQRYK